MQTHASSSARDLTAIATRSLWLLSAEYYHSSSQLMPGRRSAWEPRDDSHATVFRQSATFGV